MINAKTAFDKTYERVISELCLPPSKIKVFKKLFHEQVAV